MSAPLPPGTPDSIQPAPLPLHLPSTARIQWKKFWRIALPLAAISGVTTTLFGILGVMLFIVSIVVSIRRYRSEHAGLLMASHGMRLGAAVGLISFVAAVIAGVPEVVRNFSEIHRQMLLMIQQQAAGNQDPRAQQFVQFVATNQGMVVIIVFSMILALVFCLVLSSATGAVTAAISGDKRD